MQRRVKCLVDRLSVPHVALRLRKEEVCLAVGALSRLGSRKKNTKETIVFDSTMLRQRMLQFVPSCTALELGMISSGSLTMGWCDGSLVDQLMARMMAVGNSAASTKVPFTFEGAGHILLAAASVACTDRSVAAEHCAAFLARQTLNTNKLAVVDADQLSCAVLGTTVLSLLNHKASDDAVCSSSSHQVALHHDEFLALLNVLVSCSSKLSDVGVCMALVSSILIALSNRHASDDVEDAIVIFVEQAVAVSMENPLTVVPMIISLASLHLLKRDTIHLRQALLRNLTRTEAVVSQNSTDAIKQDDVLNSLLAFSKIVPSTQTDADLVQYTALFSADVSEDTLSSLSISLISACQKHISHENNPIMDHVQITVSQLGRVKPEDPISDAVAAAKMPGITTYRMRDTAIALLELAPEVLTAEHLAIAVQMARLSNTRDPVILQSITTHVQHLIAARDSVGAKKVLAAFGSDAGTMAVMGVNETARSILTALAQQSDGEQGSEVAEMSLPMQFKRLRERGESVSDNLLMSVLEAIDEWTVGDIAYFVSAAPDKCVEFDMLIEKLSTGMGELNAEQLSCVLHAVSESSAFALPLQDAALAQTAEMVTSIGLDAPPLISALVRLFVQTYATASPDLATLQYREELRNLIEQATGNALACLASADVMTTCAIMKAFRDCPSLGATAAEVCCGHLLTFVHRGTGACSTDELLEMLWAMAAVDAIHADLIDAMVPEFETILRNEKKKDSSVITRFLDACVALDTPELDTLFQLCLSDCVGIDNRPPVVSVEPPHLTSALNAAVLLLHRPSTGYLLTQLSQSVGAFQSASPINSVTSVLGGSSKSVIVDLLCTPGSNAVVKEEDLSYLGRQLLTNVSALIDDGKGNEINLGALFTSISRLTKIANYLSSSKSSQETMIPVIPQALVDCIMERIDSLGGPEVATIISALPYFDLGHNDTTTLLQILITRLSHECERCPSPLLSDAIFCLGELDGRIGSHITHHVAVDKMSDYCVDNVGLWTSGRNICRLLYGFSRIACNKRSLFNVFGNQLGKRPLLMLLTREDISLAMSAFGNAKYLDKELYDAMAEHMVNIADDLNPADLTLVLAGYSRMNLLNDTLYQRLGQRVAAIVEQIPVSACSKILCAYGHVGNEHDEMAERLLPHIGANASSLSGADCANTLYAVAQMNFSADTDHLDALASRIAEDKESLTTGSIDKICEVMQELNWRNDGLLRAVADQSVAMLHQSEAGTDAVLKAETARSVLDTLGFFMIHHKEARLRLTDVARTISRDPSVIAELSSSGGSSPESAKIEA